MDNISLNEACKILSISTATGRNWLKSGRLISPLSKQAVNELLINIQSNNIDKLKSRRNKNHISGAFAPKGYVDDDNIYKTVCNIISKAIKGYERVILAEYSLKLLRSVGLIKSEHSILLEEYFVKNPLIDDLLGNNSINDEIKPALIFDVEFTAGQDFLGLLYMALQTLTSRKSNGVYYTPFSVVRDTIENLQIHKPLTTIIDPCCGTGNFLINAFLYKNIMIENIYGKDIDEISIMLTRINMLLVSKTDNIEILYKNFRCEDSLFTNNNKYDVIIGNPPWGANLNHPKKDKHIESFCIFLERAIDICSDNGIISFILPEAILNVKTHKLTRQYITLKCKIKMIKYWGNVFNGVYTPAITLTLLKNNNFTTNGIIIRNEKTTFEIKTNRKVGNLNFNITDNQYKIMQKIESLKDVAYLKNNADFALGIVTGDNSKFIHTEKTENSEIILKGSDIYKYSFKKVNNYIEFTPNLFQQVAPTEMYRAKEKLLYRFICGTLVFAYDNSQTLSLNSANILIPKIDGLHIKYILAVLNSRAVQFYFSLKYNSIKILRSHIESIPIPIADADTQQKIIDKVNKINPIIYEEIDKIITLLYNLNELEIDEIQTTIQNYNLFI